ncbi:hypothetical protein [Apilactobacillus micheneri]|uniref:hypothetical protein n=1 Tax=Apilactobacillus micheneri TaxID=1899430 RepID=UPI000D03741F|nr:hypothetical protein [Apilactobacillus micheneri]
MAEENNNVYGVNNENKDNKGVVNGVSSVANSGGNSAADAANSGGSSASDVTGDKADTPTGDKNAQIPNKSQAWDGKATDVDKQRTLDITESDGTAIKLVMHFPGIFEAENILGKQVSSFTNDAGDTVEQSTMGDFHKALLRLFGTATVNGAVKNLDEGFFYEHEIQTYNYAMRQATSFLSNPNGAFKA